MFEKSLEKKNYFLTLILFDLIHKYNFHSLTGAVIFKIFSFTLIFSTFYFE